MEKRCHLSLQVQGHREEGYALSPGLWALFLQPLSSAVKALHDYETVAAEKKH